MSTTTSTLADQNPHPRDTHIHFDEGPHKYTIQDIAGITPETEFTSVTTWVHQHFEHFDAKKVIAAMMRNQKKWNDPVANAKYYGKTAQEIETMWAQAGQEAAAKGTDMHYKIECFYNQETPATLDDTATTTEFKYFLDFHRDKASKLKPYRTEWTVFHEEARIAGSIDMVYEVMDAVAPDLPTTASDPPATTEQSVVGGRNPPAIPAAPTTTAPDPPTPAIPAAPTPAATPPPISTQGERRGGTQPPLVIYDWKRCREITKTNSANKFATHPSIEHLPDTNYWHYALQLNIYKYILQAKYDKIVTDLYLVVLHPEAPTYKCIKLPDLQAEVSELFQERIDRFGSEEA
jgi:hypothetical protein